MQAEIQHLLQQLNHNEKTPFTDGFYDNVFKTCLQQGKTTILFNQEPGSNPFSINSLLTNWADDPYHRPFGHQGVTVGVYMEIPTAQILELFKMNDATTYRFAFITHVYILDGEHLHGSVYIHPHPRHLEVMKEEDIQLPVAVAVHFTTWDKITGEQLYPPIPPPIIPDQ